MIDDRIRDATLERLPKQRVTEAETDLATVDFDAGPDRLVVHGILRNGDSRHRLSLEECRFNPEANDDRLRVVVQLVESDGDDRLVMGYSAEYHYRLTLEVDGERPDSCAIAHVDEDGATQYETTEIYFH